LLAAAMNDATLERRHRAAKIAFGIMPWMPFVPSTTWVT
jgi:hypothetical protein